MSRIQSVHARQILDCKCRPMVEVDMITDDGHFGRGSAPTGSSVGREESFVLRDENLQEYFGMSVHKAVENVNRIIGPALVGMDPCDQRAIDDKMIALDGTDRKENLGGNAIYSVSIAALRTAAAVHKKTVYEYLAGGKIRTVPVPSFNMINGGKYEDLIQPFNEFIVMPYGADSIEQAVEMGVLIFRELENVLRRFLGHKPFVAPSYGYAAPSEDPACLLQLLEETVERCGYTGKVGFALDCASSEMYDRKTNTYYLKKKRVTAEELIHYAAELSEKFPLVFIEDLLDEEAWDDYPKAVKAIRHSNILGDDFIVTNAKRLRRAVESGGVDGFILKPNQVGTISEALDTYFYGKENGLIAVPSGRAGGVIGDVVMDLALGLQVGFIKNGAPRSGERIDKLNVLLRARDLEPNCRMADIRSWIKF